MGEKDCAELPVARDAVALVVQLALFVAEFDADALRVGAEEADAPALPEYGRVARVEGRTIDAVAHALPEGDPVELREGESERKDRTGVSDAEGEWDWDGDGETEGDSVPDRDAAPLRVAAALGESGTVRLALAVTLGLPEPRGEGDWVPDCEEELLPPPGLMLPLIETAVAVTPTLAEGVNETEGLPLTKGLRETCGDRVPEGQGLLVREIAGDRVPDSQPLPLRDTRGESDCVRDCNWERVACHESVPDAQKEGDMVLLPHALPVRDKEAEPVWVKLPQGEGEEE